MAISVPCISSQQRDPVVFPDELQTDSLVRNTIDTCVCLSCACLRTKMLSIKINNFGIDANLHR